ncbi:MAG: AAA family ATPase [Moorea sp. SIO3I7]|uniref:NB-ARC domain-containing protein n=1 Tax=unclassified Moorena TaxID=2683338 RepID=UPI0013BD0C45|nr:MULTISPECIES: NB-ARC domain-containing protein [unclassified Moorena]NEN99030.1 AAA family ATPase [Moorena sp. SIO3I7]NEO04982.1 AAA family ATPase [Moorena sp. SIO3I8]NEO70900.1 AAA family ATPase [Moorena sp. SIO3H5]
MPSPSYLELLGREKEIEEIKNALSDSQSKRIVGITGLGGNGKTSIAIEVARSFREIGFQNVVWQTASTKHRSTPMTFETVLDDIAKQLGKPEFLSLQGEELERKTRERLSHTPVLLVLDNMETSGDSQNEICARLSPILGNSKVLLTSRHHFETLEVDIFDYYLQGLREEASLKLMEQTAEERKISNFNPNDCESLLQLAGNNITGYLPLALKLITGQLKLKSPLEITKSLGNVRLTEDDADTKNISIFKKFWGQIFFRSFQMLSSSEFELMAILAALKEQEGTTQNVLRKMTKERLPEEKLKEAINNNWRYCLLEREEYGNHRYFLHILTSQFFSRILAYAGRMNR